MILILNQSNSMHGRKILIVDDEPDIVEMLAYNFKQDGLVVSRAGTGEEALKRAAEIVPDLILLDVMLPDIEGIEVCEQLRQNPVFENTIIVFLSARGEDYSQVAGYRAGGDDYIVKPIRIKVLRHKIKALLDRNTVSSGVTGSDLAINPERFSVSKAGKELVIPRKEFELLSLLMSIPQKVFRREEIMSRVWGESYIGDRTIDVHIRKLREKFGKNIIETVKGVGYRFIG